MADDTRSPVPTEAFSVGEKVMCWYTRYKGREEWLNAVIKCHKSIEDGSVLYLVHYKSYASSYDEWVPLCFLKKEMRQDDSIATSADESCLNGATRSFRPRKENVSYRECQSRESMGVEFMESEYRFKLECSDTDSYTEKDVKDIDLTVKKCGEELEPDASKTPQAKRRRSSSVRPSRRKRTSTGSPEAPLSHLESPRTYESKPEVKITIPRVLLNWLVIDSDNLHNNSKLVCLPCPTEESVDCILRDYVQSKKTSLECEEATELTSKIHAYFRELLWSEVLHKCERKQYVLLLDVANRQGRPLSELYGALHLLRLVVKVAEILTHSSLDEAEVTAVCGGTQEFLAYMADNADRWFREDMHRLRTSKEC